tara:strand:+ start:56 stop:478 length:423 start_codon:yes stop_codon:yes gene_type:complete
MDNDLDTNIIEFKTLGMTIEKLSIVFGLFLIFWGIFVSLLSESDSFTSYIPSFLGFPILVFSYLSIRFISKKKLFMHIVVFFGLIVLIGGLDFLRTLTSGNIFENYWADLSKLMMLITGLFFTTQCIKSFIHARKNKNNS